MSELTKGQREWMQENQGSYGLDNQMVLNLIQPLEAELDSLKSINASLIEAHDKWRHKESDLDQQIISLKSQLEKEREDNTRHINKVRVEIARRTLAEGKAEKLADALKVISKDTTRYESRGENTAWHEPSKMALIAKEFISDFEAKS